jgi:hypothetical protein
LKLAPPSPIWPNPFVAPGMDETPFSSIRKAYGAPTTADTNDRL